MWYDRDRSAVSGHSPLAQSGDKISGASLDRNPKSKNKQRTINDVKNLKADANTNNQSSSFNNNASSANSGNLSHQKQKKKNNNLIQKAVAAGMGQ